MKPVSSEKPLTLLQVIALGIGAMVGAGIFALLGQTALIMQSATWIAFACGGLVALFAGYAYARLSACYPSPGGIIDFFRLSLPAVLTIALSFLYLVTLILTVAMVARAFGAYAVQLFHRGNESALLPEVYTAFIIIAVGLMNITGSHAVGKVEVLLVGTKLVIIIALVATGVFTVDTTLLNISTFSGDTLFSAVGLTFFAYAGFGMMANASDKVADPGRVMPRAFMIAILFTIVLYISLALVLLGNLSPSQLVRYADTAVAQVAYPVWGKTGFVIVAAAALLAVRLCPNAEKALLPSHWPSEPCGQALLAALGLEPVLHGNFHLGEGTGAVALMPLLDMAQSVYRDMSTFGGMGIGAYRPDGERVPAKVGPEDTP